MTITHRDEVGALAQRGALFVINHSGGKDSQAMLIKLAEFLGPARRHQMMVIHAVLPEVDWDGIPEHIEDTTDLPVHYVQAGKTFFEMVERRGMFPSPKYRQCTSDLKRDPIDKWIRNHMRERGLSLVVSCMGIRAEESSSRAKAKTFKLNARNSKAGREWYDWMPIHGMTTVEVFGTIAEAGQEPHWAYKAGMTRLSCCFCIMASEADIRTAARLRPDLLHRYVETERRHDQTMMMPRSDGTRRFLDEVAGVDIVALAAE